MSQEFLACVQCGKEKDKTRHFYNTNNELYKNIGKLPICKLCLKEAVDPENIESVYRILQQFNIKFDIKYWEKAKESRYDTFGRYITMANSLTQFEGTGWADSEFADKKTKEQETEISTVEIETEIIDKSTPEPDNRNRQDVLRMLGYDPFIGEAAEDLNHLSNKLVDFLDESTLEDGLKLQSSIEIVKGFNQNDKINIAIANLTRDTDNLPNNTQQIKSLVESKQKILASIMKLAEENGISVKHNNQKSKGAGTLTGIIKQLQEKGFTESEVNLFNIETAQGMRQVADISNQSIMAQLQFDENDYTAMLMEQREIIDDLSKKAEKFEEENRLLKKELIKYKNGDINE
jgi:hypothetical protein